MSVDKGSKLNMFGGGDDLATVANEIYGGTSEIPDSGRVVARPTPIMSIWADVKQPRRAIPISIRMHWDGNPLEVTPMLGKWHLVAEAAAGVTLDVVKLLNGEGEGLDSDKFPSVAQEYLSLVRLAQGIKADGLINPITVVESDERLLIESGERRWLAYHLLNTYLGDQWAKIPAAKGSHNDSVWRQATENTQRRQLNAIGMARQIALLIMAARGEETYHSYEEAVKGGLSDRRFYAQVADGNVHRIPKGMSERIQAAMGLSMEQLSRYRALLEMTTDQRVNDDLWTTADVENWPEHTTREVYTLPVGKVAEVTSRGKWTLDDLKALKEAPVAKPFDYPSQRQAEPPRFPVTSEWMNKRVRTKGNETGTVVGVDRALIKIKHDGSERRTLHHFNDLTIIAFDLPSPPAASPAPMPDQYFAIGDVVRTRTGSIGEVVSVAGRLIGVKTANGTQMHDHSLLTKIAKPAPQPVEQAVFEYGEAVKVIETEEVGKIIRPWDDKWGVLHPDSHVQTYGPQELRSLGMTWEEYIKEAQLTLPEREWNEGTGEGGVNFMVGDLVKTTMGRSGGKIFELDGFGKAQVDFPGSPHFWMEESGLILVERPSADDDGNNLTSNLASQSDVLRYLDQRVQTKSGIKGKVKSVIGEWLSIERDDGGTKESFHYSTVELISDKASSVGQTEPKKIVTDWQQNFLKQLQTLASMTNDGITAIMLQDIMGMSDVQAIALADAQTLKPTLDDMYQKMSAAMENWLVSTFAVVLQQIEEAAQ